MPYFRKIREKIKSLTKRKKEKNTDHGNNVQKAIELFQDYHMKIGMNFKANKKYTAWLRSQYPELSYTISMINLQSEIDLEFMIALEERQKARENKFAPRIQRWYRSRKSAYREKKRSREQLFDTIASKRYKLYKSMYWQLKELVPFMHLQDATKTTTKAFWRFLNPEKYGGTAWKDKSPAGKVASGATALVTFPIWLSSFVVTQTLDKVVYDLVSPHSYYETMGENTNESILEYLKSGEKLNRMTEILNHDFFTNQTIPKKYKIPEIKMQKRIGFVWKYAHLWQIGASGRVD